MRRYQDSFVRYQRMATRRMQPHALTASTPTPAFQNQNRPCLHHVHPSVTNAKQEKLCFLRPRSETDWSRREEHPSLRLKLLDTLS